MPCKKTDTLGVNVIKFSDIKEEKSNHATVKFVVWLFFCVFSEIKARQKDRRKVCFNKRIDKNWELCYSVSEAESRF